MQAYQSTLLPIRTQFLGGSNGVCTVKVQWEDDFRNYPVKEGTLQEHAACVRQFIEEMDKSLMEANPQLIFAEYDRGFTVSVFTQHGQSSLERVKI